MTYIAGMFIFLLSVTFLSIAFDREDNKTVRRLFGCACVTVFLIFVYYRPYLFRDTITYEVIYNSVDWSYLDGFDLLKREPITSMEYGFIFIVLLFRSIHIPFRLFSAIISACGLFTFYRFAVGLKRRVDDECCSDNNENDFMLLFCLFTAYIGNFYSMVAIRGLLCFIFIIISAYYALKHNFICEILFLLLAFTVQRFAILAIIPLMIISFWNFEFNRYMFKRIWMILGPLVLLSYLFQNLFFYTSWERTAFFLGDFYAINLDKIQDTSVVRLIQYIAYWFTGLLICKTKLKDEIISKLSLIYLLGDIVCILFSGYMSAYRIVDYFYMFSIPLLYVSNFNWISSKLSKNALYITLILMFLLTLSKQYLNWYTFDF